MAFFDLVKEAITNKPPNLKAPHFYKVDSDAKNQLEQLKEISKTASSKVKSQIEQDIKMLTYGIAGEENVAFELSNSYMPIIVLHDLRIECDGLSAQIDFMIITTKFTLLVECKNLFGNIEVNGNGDFIRTVEYGGKYKKEGIYSPITQNKRHLEMIKKVRSARLTNFLFKSMFEKNFDDNYKTVVVLANPKTIINLKYAKKEIKDQIIRCDQLIEHIKRLMKESKSEVDLEKFMYERADFFLGLHTPNSIDYSKKYVIENIETVESEPIKAEPKSEPILAEPKPMDIKLEETPIYKELKQYRYETSKAEDVKAYFIYSNAQMEELISAMPKTLEDIKKISGFGDVKCQKYGNAILEIIKRHVK